MSRYAAARGWLAAELAHIHVFNRRVTVRRHHGIGLILALLVAFVVGLAVGVFAGYHYPYRTLPAPKVPPGQTVPDCAKLKQHKLGECLPQPKAQAPQNAASITATTLGPDLSNNDPIYGDGNWSAIGSRNSFAIFKVNESTTYADSTAAPMASYAKRHGLAVGGYDFLHVCGPPPGSEARVFVAYLKADGLTGPGTLPGTGDAEYGGSGCDARAWIASWAYTVYSLTGRWPMFYTGAWWWQPHLGSYWPIPSIAWVSGYGVRYPYMPSGRSQLDVWQFADNGFNGVTSADLSTWRDGAAAFNAAIGRQAPKADPYAIFPKTVFTFGAGNRASEYNTVRTWDREKCRIPVRRPVCRSSYFHLRELRDREWFVAHHARNAQGRWVVLSKPRWAYPKAQPLGSRFQLLTRRLEAR